MNKIKAVVKREYLTRVRKKSFIIITILIPVGILLLMGLPFLMAFMSVGTTNIAILSHSEYIQDNIEGGSNLHITFITGEEEYWKEEYKKHGYDAFLYISHITSLQYLPTDFTIYSDKQVGISLVSNLRSQINDIIENARFEQKGFDREEIDNLRSRIGIKTIVISKDGERAGNMLVALGTGQLMGFFMYFLIFIYGSMIMKCVIDEKKNRIVEILVSSIKPFDLMCGKIIGIAAVALTQLLIWLILTSMIFAFFIVGVIPYMDRMNSGSLEAVTEMTPDVQNTLAMQIVDFLNDPGAINIPLILTAFCFYFLFGYLFYSTLFAAIGSVSDDEAQAQTFTLPISLPIILSILVMVNVVENPHSSLGIWASIIPFSSPIVMLARLPFNVPIWQIIVSALTLIVSFIACTWAAGKIYRTGILLYGKKLNWKDLWKFVRA